MLPDDVTPRARDRTRSRPFRRGGAIAIVLLAAAAIAIIGVMSRASGRAIVAPSPPPGSVAAGSSNPAPPADHGYLGSLAELRDRAARAAAGQAPEAAAVKDLLDWSRGAVDGQPNPSEPLRIDGTTGPFVDDSASAYGLALAWAVSGDPRDALAARRYVMAWVAQTKTLLGACPSDGDCQTSLIVSRAAPGFVFAVDLLGPSGVLSAADDSEFRDWLRTVILPAASERTNNWGDAGVFLRVVGFDFLGDTAGFGRAVDAWRAQLDLIASDGHIPEEVRRGSAGLSYTQEALMYKVAVARIAERRGIDLWSYVGAGGGTVRKAVDLAARYEQDPTGWPWAQGVDVPAPAPLWELVYEHWPESTFAVVLAAGRPFGSAGHSAVRWTTLTNGIAFGS